MKIAISIILYKSPIDVVRKNLDMLSKQDFLEDKNNYFEIFFSDNDNGLQINIIKELTKKYPNLSFNFIVNDNIGFGGANNKAFYQINNNNKGQFDYFLIMNPDGISHPRMLKKLTDFAISHNNKGIFESIQFPSEHPKIYNPTTKETRWCSGCCCLYPWQIFQELQGFDENFFMYMEDVDISWRAREKGYKCFTVNDALFFHSVEDRKYLKNTEIMMYKSAYILSLKYRNNKKKRIYLKNLEKLLNNEDLLTFLNETSNIELPNINNFINIADFNHNFYFSEARW